MGEGKVKEVAIYPNILRDPDGAFCDIIKARLDRMGIKHSVIKGRKKIPKTAEMIISLGGDGTILRCATREDSNNIPILSINVGHMGFMTTINGITPEDLETFDKILTGEYNISERLMLDVEYKNKHRLALNDTIIRAGASKVVKIGVYVNEDFIKEYVGDGVIVSTPSGSTGYALSVGNVPVDPRADVLLVTPISAIGIGLKGFIATGKDEIVLEARDVDNTKVYLTVDGSDNKAKNRLSNDDRITIRKSVRTARLVREKGGMNFYDTVREKLCEHSEKGRVK
jgi:NAD+ kinase